MSAMVPSQNSANFSDGPSNRGTSSTILRWSRQKAARIMKLRA